MQVYTLQAIPSLHLQESNHIQIAKAYSSGGQNEHKYHSLVNICIFGKKKGPVWHTICCHLAIVFSIGVTPLFINWWDKYIYDPVERSPDLESANMFFMFLIIFPKYPYVYDKSPIHIKIWLGYIMLQYILCNLISTHLKRDTYI